jgi:hypothetical protein
VTRKTMRFVPVKSADQQAAAVVLKTRCKRRRQNPSLKRPESLVAPEQKCTGS